MSEPVTDVVHGFVALCANEVDWQAAARAGGKVSAD